MYIFANYGYTGLETPAEDYEYAEDEYVFELNNELISRNSGNEINFDTKKVLKSLIDPSYHVEIADFDEVEYEVLVFLGDHLPEKEGTYRVSGNLYIPVEMWIPTWKPTSEIEYEEKWLNDLDYTIQWDEMGISNEQIEYLG